MKRIKKLFLTGLVGVVLSSCNGLIGIDDPQGYQIKEGIKEYIFDNVKNESRRSARILYDVTSMPDSLFKNREFVQNNLFTPYLDYTTTSVTENELIRVHDSLINLYVPGAKINSSKQVTYNNSFSDNK